VHLVCPTTQAQKRIILNVIVKHMENSNSNSMLTLVTKNLIQNPLKLRENPEAYLSTSHLTTGRRLPAQYEESLEPED